MFSLEFQAESSQTKNISIKHNFEAKLTQNVAQFRSGRPPAAENSISGRFGAPKGIQKSTKNAKKGSPKKRLPKKRFPTRSTWDARRNPRTMFLSIHLISTSLSIVQWSPWLESKKQRAARNNSKKRRQCKCSSSKRLTKLTAILLKCHPKIVPEKVPERSLGVSGAFLELDNLGGMEPAARPAGQLFPPSPIQNWQRIQMDWPVQQDYKPGQICLGTFKGET